MTNVSFLFCGYVDMTAVVDAVNCALRLEHAKEKFRLTPWLAGRRNDDVVSRFTKAVAIDPMTI